MQQRESPVYIVLFAAKVCFACSLVVAAAAVGLRGFQEENKKLDTWRNILAVADLVESDKTVGQIGAKKVAELYKEKVEPIIIDLETGDLVDDYEKLVDEGWDQRKASKDPEQNKNIEAGNDRAGLGQRETKSYVYLVKDDSGNPQTYIFPIRGKGLWSTLWGFLALDATDLNTVKGITFYEHAETPGLGGEVDNSEWKAHWVGKEIYGESGGVKLQVVKGKVVAGNTNAVHQIDGLSGATITSRGVENTIHYWLGENGFKQFIDNQKQSPKS